MATGSITTLGLGSGLELQSILDQLKAADAAPITAKTTKKETLAKKVDAYNSVNAKLFAMKSSTLTLSLESDFMKNKITVSDEDVLTAIVSDGVAESASNMEVVRKASFNSWQSSGVASKGSVIYTEPATDITDSDASLTTADETISILYGAAGSQQSISISLESGMSLNDISEAINASDSNRNLDGGQLVTASVETNDDNEYYIRLSATSGGNSADSQINVSGFDYVKADTTISIGRADSEDLAFISVAPGTTYQEATDLINNSVENPGVKAEIIDDGSSENPYKMVLPSKASGEKHRISIQNLPLTEVAGAAGASLNAEFKVNGITYQRQSNDAISDVVSGVTFNIKKIGETTISIQRKTDDVKENILSLVDGYNKLHAEIKGTSDTTSETDASTTATTATTATEETDNPLKDDYSIKNILSRLQSLFSTRVETGSDYNSLFDLGLTINDDGTMSLDETTLDQALAADPNAIASLFIGDADAGITGLGDTINKAIGDMVGSNGAVLTGRDSATVQITRLEKDIETANERLDKRYQILTKQFVQLDTYIKQLNSESTYMQSVIDSFNNTTSN